LIFDERVHGFIWPVRQAGAVPAQDLVLPTADRGGEAAELDDVGCAAPGVEALEPPAGLPGERVVKISPSSSFESREPNPP
jgi:hypothetical protein